jgi:hypothetical protein
MKEINGIQFAEHGDYVDQYAREDRDVLLERVKGWVRDTRSADAEGELVTPDEAKRFLKDQCRRARQNIQRLREEAYLAGVPADEERIADEQETADEMLAIWKRVAPRLRTTTTTTTGEER